MATPRPHLLLNARAGWQAAILDRVVLRDQGTALQLRALPGAARPLTDADGTFGGLENPVGLAVDGLDRLYILDGKKTVIKRYDPCRCAFETLPCIGLEGDQPRRLRDPKGLAISPCNDLWVADTGNGRLQIFAVKGLALREIRGPFRVIQTAEGPSIRPAASLSDPNCWRPWDVAISHRGRAYVADYANGLIHEFDAQGCWRGAHDGASPGSPPLKKPIRVAVDRAGRIYVVQEGADSVVVMDADGRFLARVTAPEELEGRFCPAAVAVDAAGHLHVGDRFTGRMCCYQPGDTGYQFAGASTACPGGAVDLVFNRSGSPVIADPTGKVIQLSPQATLEPLGRFYTDALDSRLYRCPWHRVVLHASIAAGSQIQVDTLTSEAPKTVAEIRSLPEGRWDFAQADSTVGTGEWDCLVPSAPGRYLWLRLTLAGDGFASPCVDRIRIDYPRASSLQYLPAVYSQDDASRDFLDRFLSIFDAIWSELGDRIGSMAGYFDPMAVPASCSGAGCTDFLTWLASWLGMSPDRHWPEERRRRLVANAHRLYALRGTPEGLRLHIELYTGRRPYILEHFKLRRWMYLDHARLGDQSAVWGDQVVNRLQLDVNSQLGSCELIDTGDPLRDPFYKEAHQFTVFMPMPDTVDPLELQTLERIIEMAKPAHALGHLRLVRPRFRVGVQSFLGMDTMIGAYPEGVVEGTSKLGADSVLGQSVEEEGPPRMRVGTLSRIGSTTWVD
jgi:phage tail-like protein